MALYLLGRRLMQVAERALPQGKASSARLVYVDVAYHPDSSISEITERTGFPQSLVSTSVARLRELGLLESGPDPRDRRRTLVRTTPARRPIEGRLKAVSIDDILVGELPEAHHGDAAEMLAALELLSRLLTPEVLADDEEGAVRE